MSLMMGRRSRRSKSCGVLAFNSASLNPDNGLDFDIEYKDLGCKFIDLQEVGSGYGGVVFKSVHTSSGKVIARKVLSGKLESPRIRKSVTSELTTLRKCSNPCIVDCYGVSLGKEKISLALEWMDIGSLDSVLRRTKKAFPEKIVRAICQKIIKGLTYLHDEHNMIHRDLKPSNVLLNKRGEVKLCDFGESTMLVKGKAISMVGTTGYMAPERISGTIYDCKSDIWSLGITAIELATGVFPYFLDTDARMSLNLDSKGMKMKEPALIELWEAISSDPSPKLDTSTFSKEFCNFVEQCLIKDPMERAGLEELKKHPFCSQKIESSVILDWIETFI